MEMKLYRFFFAIIMMLMIPKAFAFDLNNTPCSNNSNIDSGTLVILLHAFTASPDSFNHVVKSLKNTEEYANAYFSCPQLPFELFSTADPGTLVADLLHAIDELWDENQYENILFVGHSMGSLFARKVYAAASGENPEAKFERSIKYRLTSLGASPTNNPRPWASKVSRIVLMAGMNRGWSISHHMSLTRGVSMSIGSTVGKVMSWFTEYPPVIFSIRRGAPFITELRLQWLAMRNNNKRLAESIGNVLTVQLLGSIDDLVSPEDNIDLVSGRDFVYLDVPYSGHKNVIDMDSSAEGKERTKKFEMATTWSKALLESEQVYPAEDMPDIENDVTDVVFVIHGIRDEGYWTHKIARYIKASARDISGETKSNVRSVTSSYGYFPMLSFLKPGARQEKVEWLMDQYTEAKARYPKATFSYVGHSNGTYLLTKALEDYGSIQFENIVFAGSVVNRNYDWSIYVPAQAKNILNFMASADWVVAFFPNALQSINVQDLGSAGHDGFSLAADIDELVQPKDYVAGGHGAALHEDLWSTIAHFVLTGKFESNTKQNWVGQHNYLVSYPAKAAILIWVVIGIILLFLLRWILTRDLAEWLKTVMVLSYLGLLFTVLTMV